MSGLTVAQVLDAAADLIAPEGAWTQGRLVEYDPYDNPICFCALGALMWVSSLDSEVIRFVERGLPKVRHGGLTRLASFNDAPERTQAEVVAKLREAAALARSEGK